MHPYVPPDDMDLLPKYKKTAVIEFQLALTHTYNDHLRASESKGMKGRKKMRTIETGGTYTGWEKRGD